MNSTYSAIEAATVRGNAYSHLSDLLLSGLSEDAHVLWREVVGLASAVKCGFDVDEAAAQHHRVLVRGVPPHETLFLSSHGMLGGELADQLAAQYVEAGYCVPAGCFPDHMGVELGFLSYLCSAEVAARKVNADATVRRLCRQQQEFLWLHPLRWIAPLWHAVQQEGDQVYSEAATLIVDLLADHAKPLGLETADAFPHFLACRDLNIDNHSTSLGSIAAFLSIPASSGFYLSYQSIRFLASDDRLPHGFGRRKQQLQTLLRASAEYDRLVHVVDRLLEWILSAQCSYQHLLDQHPHLSATVTPWCIQSQRTHDSIGALRQRVGELLE